MHFSTALLTSFAVAATALAVPLPTPASTPDNPTLAAAAAAAASKKNVYLSTCTTRGLLGPNTTLTVIYYNKAASPSSSPTDVGTLSGRARTWEGATRRTQLDAGAFESHIDSGAADLEKSQLAGTGKLGGEDLVCFVDGVTEFAFEGGLLGLGASRCTAEYWCASIGSGADV